MQDASSTATTASDADGDGDRQTRLAAFISRLPKAELHVHVEGTLQPDLMMALAARNGVQLPWPNAAAAAAARAEFTGLQDFLDAYYAGLAVLVRQRDFLELADAYLARAAAQGIRHCELFFDPQAHMLRGIPFDEFFPGLWAAVEEARRRHGLTASLIMCFLRELGPQAAAETLEQALPFRDQIAGVGLDSTERGYPPQLFARVFERAAQLGWHRVAHAGEEGPAEYVWQAMSMLGVERIDHGIHCLDDPQLVAHLEATGTPLTLCPLSNLRLQVYPGCLEARLRQLVHGTQIALTVNSDDPAYFGGMINANYEYLAAVAGLDEQELAHLAAASFKASFLDPASKAHHVAAVRAVLHDWQRQRCGENVGHAAARPAAEHACKVHESAAVVGDCGSGI